MIQKKQVHETWGPLRLLMAALIALAANSSMAAEPTGEVPSATEGETTEAEQPERHAFKLGDFHIKNFRPVEHEKVRLEFTVWMEVEEGQQERFAAVLESRQHRIRNQIITSARLVPPNEFDDPTLEALRRRIYLRLRRAVPELPVGKVFLSDFSYLME